MFRLLTTILLLTPLSTEAQFRGLIINASSQGDQGSREYIELLVVGNRTCSDSTADLRGWIIDDQNGWYGNTNISDGHYRFKQVPQWAAVPFGSIIVLYNAASGQKNLSLTLPDDSTDANRDHVYVLPINTKSLLEEHDNEPNNATPSPSYVYPAAASTTGYSSASNLWVQHIALNNTGGDVLSIISPNKRDSASYSIGYGYTVTSGFRQPKVAIGNVATGFNASLVDSFYNNASRWYIAPVPLNETPGLPNGGVNSLWIAAMRSSPVALHTYTTSCSNGPYTFFGQTITATGAYTVLYKTPSGCVDTNDLYVVIKGIDSRDTVACDSLIYKGKKYTSNAVITDIIPSVVINCDSLVRTLRITIKKSSSSYTRTCIGAQQTYTFNGQTITAGGMYTANLVNAQGCDSVARLYLTKTRLDSATVGGCTSVAYNGLAYTQSTLLYDTTKSLVTGCDSLIRRVNIVVYSPAFTHLSACGIEGVPYLYNSSPLSMPGLYTFNFKTTAGCDSVVKLYLVFSKTVSASFAGCDSVFFQNKWYFGSTTLRDTFRSTVSGCDSLVNLVQLVVNQSKTVAISACVAAGSSYSFFGQTLTSSGIYTHRLQTLSGCDSLVRLQLTVTQKQTKTYTGCDSLVLNGQSYFSSTILADTLRNQAACDSLIKIDSVIVRRIPRSYINVCLPPGQTYNFNGQLLTASGSYQTRYTAMPCDSVVYLNLLIATEEPVILRGCRSLTYNGVTYSSSTALTDTVRSRLSGCDSIYRRIQIQIQTPVQSFKTTCLAQGSTFLFNGQLLSATGQYTATYTTAAGCDSIVNLYLVVSRTQADTISGCEKVLYNGASFSTSAIISDTIRSVVTGCDSLINRVTILVFQKPALTLSKDTAVCLGTTAKLFASAPGSAISWIGFGTVDSLTVAPQATTKYTALAVDGNGCQNSGSVTVLVEDLNLRLYTNNPTALSGTNMLVSSSANLPNWILKWEPMSSFANQAATQQSVYVDTPVQIAVIAQTVNGCRDTARLQLAPVLLDDVYIPSGFTPNGDGRNDEVRVVGTGIREIDFKIFNRWGQLLFSTTDRGRGWNGKYGGVLQSTGVYVYAVRIKKANGQMIAKKGTVTLIR